MTRADASTTPAFSPSRRAGELVFVSGQLPIAQDGSVSPDATAQVHAAIDGIERVLAADELSLGDVVRLGYFLADRDDLGALRTVVHKRFAAPLPAATLVIVAGLADPRCRFEIDAIAVRP